MNCSFFFGTGDFELHKLESVVRKGEFAQPVWFQIIWSNRALRRTR